jgi:serine protease AprX
MSDDGLTSDRQRVRNALGAEFEQKASDEFCARFVRGRTRGPGSATVLEMTDLPDGFQVPPGFEPAPEVPPAPPAQPRMRGRGAPPPPPDDDEEDGPEVQPDPVVEQAQVRSLAFMEEVRAFLARPPGPRMRGRSAPGGPGARFDVCWLNHSVRARLSPPNARRIAELAGDPRVRRIDTTRALEPEMLRSIPALLGEARMKARAALTRVTERKERAVVVAVIDSEIDRDHPALKGRVFRRGRFTEEGWRHPSRHGTAVAGVIAANGEVVGMAPDAILYNYKVLGSRDPDDADDFDLGLALQRAVRHRARIANVSLGTSAATDGTSREVIACNRAWELGLTIVKSAGNKGNGEGTITCPGDAKGVILVGATDEAGRGVQEYSSRGPTKNGKQGPDLVAPGGRDEIATIQGLLPDGTIGCCGWGTTLAAAHISGLLALMLDENPELTPDQLKEMLIARCVPFRCDESVQGYGFPRLA